MNSKINNIILSGDAKLTFNIGNKDISIVVNKISGGGHLNIIGKGKLTIYLIDNIRYGHVNSNGNNNLYIYIGPSETQSSPKTVKSSDYGNFNASIYAIDANIKLVGSGKIKGILQQQVEDQ